MYDLVDRYLRRLDQELHKFKMELEADNRGITELLEKRNILFIYYTISVHYMLAYNLPYISITIYCNISEVFTYFSLFLNFGIKNY